MKTSKVKTVVGDGTWAGHDGTTFYKFIYTMEDGTVLQASHKSENNALEPGDPCEYDIKRTHATYGNSGSVRKPKEQPSGGHGSLIGIKVGHALNCASVLLAPRFHEIPAGAEEEMLERTALMIYRISEKMNKTLENPIG